MFLLSHYTESVFYKEEPNLTLQFVRRNTAAYISLHSPLQPKLQNQVMYPSGYLADTTFAIPQELELVLIDSQCLTVIKQFPEVPE